MLKKILKFSLIALFMVSIVSCSGRELDCDCETGRDANISDNSTIWGCGINFPDNHTSFLVNIELKCVENGTFVMGSDSTNATAYPDVNYARPKHNVTISKPYYLGIYEVTQGQWLSVNGSNPSRNDEWSSEIAAGTANMSNHPVNNVNIESILGFIQAMNDAEPDIMINGEQYVYDLPSEAEWEYAARGGTTSERFFCEDNSSDCTVPLMLNYGWFSRNSNMAHQIVGTLQPNPWGFYDMYGNMEETVLDTGHSRNTCLYPTEDITDPLCYNENTFQLARGAYMWYSPSYGYSAFRSQVYSVGGRFTGFRVALVAKSVRDNMTKYANGTIIQ